MKEQIGEVRLLISLIQVLVVLPLGFLHHFSSVFH